MPDIETPDAAAILLSSIAQDSVCCFAEMPLKGVFHPLGFSVDISTNSREVLTAAEESWGRCAKAFSEPAVHLRVGVVDAENGVCPQEPTWRAWRNLLVTVADAGNCSVCDLRQGAAFSWLTQAAVENRPYLRYYFLEGPALSLLEKMYLAPLHAACVRLEDQGVLLCGDSGAGKSSLAYACARRGWTYISDDTSSLIRSRKQPTIVGNPYQFRFREAGVELFPELAKQDVTRRGTGEFAIELATATLPEITTDLTSSVEYVVFLNRRNANPPSLVPFSQETAMSWFDQLLTFGENETLQAQSSAYRKLLGTKMLELRYRDLDWAVDRLETLVREGS